MRIRTRVAAVAVALAALLAAAPAGGSARAETAPAATGALVPDSTAASSGTPSATGWTAARSGGGQWLEARWRTPQRVSAVRIAGGSATAGGAVRQGSLRFSDGSRVVVGRLERRGGFPTTVAFTPRAVTAVRFVADAVGGGGRASLASFAVYPVGVVPAVPAVRTPTFRAGTPAARSCDGVTATGATADLRLLCPTNGSATSGDLRVVVSGPAGAALTAAAYLPKPAGTGGAVGTVATGTIDGTGTGRLLLPVAGLLHGPAAVRITAAGVRTPLYVQLVNGAGVAQPAPTTAFTRTMDLKVDEEFDGPLSATRTGASAVYASGKPNSYGVDDFGDAIFAAPGNRADRMSTIAGGYLRIPVRPLGRSEVDDKGYGRRVAAGLLASAHLGGSGTSVQYGYFEARMLAPAGEGTWPAFWMMSSGGLSRGGSQAEIDAVELYGEKLPYAFHATHSWIGGEDDPSGKQVFTPHVGGGGIALSWHTYGARVTPKGVAFYVDGVLKGRTPPVVKQDEPMFWMVNLALTGDWRTGLAATGHRAALYVDSVRVWV